MARRESALRALRKGLRSGLSERLELRRPNVGRLFMCGSPEAGKTQLARSMMEAAATQCTCLSFLALGCSCLPLFGKQYENKRTEGVEIQLLRKSSLGNIGPQIFVWDLAGQQIYRTLQQYLFPKFNRACLFAFVFSPCNSEGQLKHGLSKIFADHFRSWLRFLASNLDVVGRNLARVVVVITHKDQAGPLLGSVWPRARDVEDVAEDFKEVMKIRSTPFFIDGRNLGDVEPFLEFVDQSFHELFTELAEVPKVCIDVNRSVTRWISKNRNQPIVNFDEFVSLCREAHPDLKKLPSDPGLEVFQALGMYLHDVGTVIHLSGLIILDPNWLTSIFLGRLIGMGHGFQQSETLMRDQLPDQWSKVNNLFEAVKSTNGFIPKKHLENILNTLFLESSQGATVNQGWVRDNSILERIMTSLDLCLEIPLETAGDGGNSCNEVFIPTVFQIQNKSSASRFKWSTGKTTTTSGSCFGIRLRCGNKRTTYLSEGFFSRFQVYLYKKWSSLIRSSHMIVCVYNLISLVFDGHEVMVENDGEIEGDHFDVLVKSEKSRKVSWKFAIDYVVDAAHTFCLESGSPGVDLVMEIRRIECARDLTPSPYRKDQAVSVDVLKEELKESLGEVYTTGVTAIEDGDTFVHTWPEVKDPNSRTPHPVLQRGSERVVDLLPPNDLLEIREWVQNRSQLVIEKVSVVSAAIKALEKPPSLKKITLDTKRLQKSRSDMMVGTEKISHLIESQVIPGIKQIQGSIEDLKGLLTSEIRALHFNQQKLHETLAEMDFKLDNVLGYSASVVETEIPCRRPYFTSTDGGVVHRLTAFVSLSTPMRLHLMCEARNACHMVDGQPGMEISIDKENMDVVRSIAASSVKVLWYLLKAGMQVTTGNLVPEIQSNGVYSALSSIAGTAIESLAVESFDSISSDMNITQMSEENLTKSSGSHARFREILRPLIKDRIPELFLLYRVRYIRSDPQSAHFHGWLCKTCQDRGIKEGEIQP